MYKISIYFLTLLFAFLTPPSFSSDDSLSRQQAPLPNHTYTDARGTYNVDEIIQWANKNQNKWTYIQTSNFLEYTMKDTWGEDGSESMSNLKRLLQENDEKERVMSSDLECPIVVDNAHRIIDGVHRIIKAAYLGKETIKCIFIDRTTLQSFCLTSEKSIKVESSVKNLPISDIFIHVPKAHLPSDQVKRRNLLEEYFSDHLPSAYEENDQWLVQLERPSSPYGCYNQDQTLKEGLTWWRDNTRIRDIPAEYKLYKNGILAIEDQWMPLSWSLFFQRLGRLPEELVLLHVDDHQDMMSPRIGRRLDGTLIDFITGNTISFLEPETIKAAILSGAIGKGSILIPLIHAIKKVCVRHLSFRPYPQNYFYLNKLTTKDEVIGGLNNRIIVQTEATCFDNLQNRSSYLVSNNIKEWLREIPKDVPILLHFDMDYFNNRFDGNSNWETELTRKHNLSLLEQKKLMADIFTHLAQEKLISRIDDIGIGISAGFFPAEFWSPMISCLFEEAEKIGLNIGKEQ